ncbi:MAG: prenyltransferase/squalene oxidase repeat-containing protein [Planctomycetaceae bacterium]
MSDSNVLYSQDAPKPEAAPAVPAQSTIPLTETKVVERVTSALDKSIEYLANHQHPDGSWDNCNAGNALAILALLGRGHVPGRGPYRDVLAKGQEYLLRTQNEQGVFISKRMAGSGPMYEHGLCTLACSELYGMDPSPELEAKLRKAVDVIVASQSPAGGWRYHPTPNDQDLSVTVMQVVALRAANNAEIPVPQATIDKAIQYVRSCAHPNGGFGYQAPAQTPQTSAAGVVSLQLLGQYTDPSVANGLTYLESIPVEWSASGAQYFYYFHYYAIQAQYQAGGKWWNNWHPKIRELLLSHQLPDGSWDVPAGTAEQANVVGDNRIYWTSMASLILEIYMHYLPAYQR